MKRLHSIRRTKSASYPFIWCCALFLCIALAGCATSSGSLFESEASASGTTASDTAGSSSDNSNGEDDEVLEEAEEGLRIRTSPSRARIIINGRYSGTSPLLLDLPTGSYQIRAEKSGYYSSSTVISHVAGTFNEISLDLEEITGTLVVETFPSDARIQTGLRRLTPGSSTELPIGSYLLDISAFGYETVRTTVLVEENRTSYFTVKLEEAPFRIDYIAPRRNRFSPADPGVYGTMEYSIAVSGPGSVEYRILNREGTPISGPISIDFNQRWNRIFWDGTDFRGNVQGDGQYTLQITGDALIQEEHRFHIDRTVTMRVRAAYGGSGGTLFCPLPGALPAGAIQGGIFSLAHADGSSYIIPAIASIRFAVKDREEITVSGGIIARNSQNQDGTSIPFGTVSWSLPLFSTEGLTSAGSLLLKAGYFHESVIDPMANFTGLSAGLPLSLRLGPFTLAIAPELSVSPDRVTGGDEEKESNAAISTWGYGKAALIMDLGPLTGALSAALRSAPFDTGFSADWPLAAGAELHWLLPQKIITISAASTIHWDPERGWYMSAGGGLSLLH
jgi:hypothetical protein